MTIKYRKSEQKEEKKAPTTPSSVQRIIKNIPDDAFKYIQYGWSALVKPKLKTV
jgi:hypothetical protein